MKAHRCGKYLMDMIPMIYAKDNWKSKLVQYPIYGYDRTLGDQDRLDTA